MARQWIITGKYPIRDSFGEVESTVIQLVSSNEDYAQFTETVLGDHTTKTDSELIKLAKDQYFKKEYSDYAMEEAVIKVDELDKKIKEVDALTSKFEKSVNDTKLKAELAISNLEKAEETRNVVFGQLIERTESIESGYEVVNATLNEFMMDIYSIIEQIPVSNEISDEDRII